MKLYKKIDIYQRTPHGLDYICSTNQSRTCKEALIKFTEVYKVNPALYKACKAKI